MSVDRTACGPAEVRVWLVRTGLQAPTPAQWQLLDAGERERAGRFQFAHDRDHYVLAHAWLRILLAEATGRRTDRLSIVQAPLQKPWLREADGSPARPFFNLSHTAGLVAVAVSDQAEVGVDVEGLRPWTEVAALPKLVLHSQEARILAGLPLDERASYFFKVWCAKEAYTKATGLGLSHPFDSFSVGFGRAGGEGRDDVDRRALSVPGHASACLQVATLDTGHAWAVAALSPGLDLRLQRV